MADLSKNGGIVLAPNHLPAPQPLPDAPGLTQHLENGQLHQYMTTSVAQNNSGVQEMLKGKLMALGITEMVSGIISIIIGIIVATLGSDNSNYDVGFSIIGGTPWWTGAVLIIAGSLAVAVEKSPTDGMIKGCLAMNIISAIFCKAAMIIYSVNIALSIVSSYCYLASDCNFYGSGTVACLAILLVLALLNATISVAISSFNCKAVTCCNTTPVPIIVVYSNPSAQPNPSIQFNGNPPPYNTYEFIGPSAGKWD